MKRSWIGLCFLFASLAAESQTLGTMQQAFDVQVLRIFSGNSTTYVTFSSLLGCNGNGGYVTVSWPAANGGVFDQHRTSQILATLLYAKSTQNLMEVRYRRNSTGTGWDSCAVDAIYLN